ncbi:MFS transporter [Streptomyces sp. NBC_00247]|uniref:MFS transporter n=1 Tax=Streptomyces sp. NBC_00247 TaxID=2975689 RepID=UPI002E2C9B7A|nr:MFS transporter [Streptomyces sp. NBC_00247]
MSVRRDVNLYWCGQTATAFGTVFTAIALPVVALTDLGATAGQVGLISAASTVPGIVLGLLAGVLADRIVHPRRAMMLLDLLSAAAVGGVALGLRHGVASIGWLMALGLVQGFLAVLLSSLYFVHLRQLVGAEAIGPARARLQAGQFGAALVGRILAGPVIALFGSAAALGTDAASYLLSALALVSMRSSDRTDGQPGTGKRGEGLRGAAAGLRFFAGHPFHRALLLFLVAPAAALAGAATLTGPFLLRTVHVPVGVYGLAFVLAGVMGLTGSAIAGRLLGPGRDARTTVLAGFAGALLTSALLPVAAGPLPVAVFCAALGIGLPVLFGAVANVALVSVLATDVEESMMGRAMAGLQVITSSTVLVGALAGGFLGDLFGVRTALWVLTGTALLVVGLVGPAAVRAARDLHEAEADEAAEGEADGARGGAGGAPTGPTAAV